MLEKDKKKNGITFRKARGKEDVSCDYSEYTAIKKQKIKNKTVRFAMKKKKVLNATWYDKERAELVYDIDRCIGCGQCVTQCPSGYRSMVKDERNIFVKTRKKVDYGRNL